MESKEIMQQLENRPLFFVFLVATFAGTFFYPMLVILTNVEFSWWIVVGTLVSCLGTLLYVAVEYKNMYEEEKTAKREKEAVIKALHRGISIFQINKENATGAYTQLFLEIQRTSFELDSPPPGVVQKYLEQLVKWAQNKGGGPRTQRDTLILQLRRLYHLSYGEVRVYETQIANMIQYILNLMSTYGDNLTGLETMVTCEVLQPEGPRPWCKIEITFCGDLSMFPSLEKPTQELRFNL